MLHQKAMSKMTLPRDYIAAFTGEHFTYNSIEDDEVNFISAHRNSFELLSEVRPNYSDRRLKSAALPYTMFLLLESDVRNRKDEEITSLFVEAFGDQTSFFNVCVRELEKAETIIEAHTEQVLQNENENEDTIEDDGSDMFLSATEGQEEKIQRLIDLFIEKDIITMSRYIKIFPQGILGIAHAKLNSDFNKIFQKLRLSSDESEKKHVKSFTKSTSSVMSGEGSMIATSCKIFYLNKFSSSFQEMLYKLFNMEVPEMSDREESEYSQSQDYPHHSQSRTMETLQVCKYCSFKSRDVAEFKNHMESHPKCSNCGLQFKTNAILCEHEKNFHAQVSCIKCGKLVLENNLATHMKGHNIETEFRNVIGKGKISARSSKRIKTKEPKEVKLTAYRMFMKTKRP